MLDLYQQKHQTDAQTNMTNTGNTGNSRIHARGKCSSQHLGHASHHKHTIPNKK